MRQLELQSNLETKPETGISSPRDSDCRSRFSGFSMNRVMQETKELDKKKQHCHYVIYQAIKKGLIKKPERCSWCMKKSRIVGHHKNYNEPFRIDWICYKCHFDIHPEVGFQPSNKPKVEKLKKPYIDKKSITINGTLCTLPMLKDEPYQTDGILMENRVVDEHEFFSEMIDWKVVLNRLSYREREIIKLRYGIGDGYTYTLEEVSRIFKVTCERVRQVEAKAIRKLWHLLNF